MFTHRRFGWIKNLTEIVRLNRTNTYSCHRRFDDLCWPSIDKINEQHSNNGSDAVCANCTTAVQLRSIRISNQLPGSRKGTFKFKLKAFYHDEIWKFIAFVSLVHKISAETSQNLHSTISCGRNKPLNITQFHLPSTNFWESLCYRFGLFVNTCASINNQIVERNLRFHGRLQF